MSFDAHKNLAYSLVATAPSPAISGTTLTVTAGQGALFPAVPFNATVWAISQIPVTTNAEIVRVTNITGDVLTLTRAQESTAARTIVIGDQIAATITAKTLTDVETAIPSTVGLLSAVNVSAGTTSNNLSAVTFSNANGVSFGLNGSVLTGTVQTNYLTTAMLSNAVTLSNIRVSAGTTSNLLSAITFSNSNGVSFGINASTITGSVATSLTNVNLSAGTTSNNLSAFVFSNSNNVSFGLNGSTVTGTVTVASTQASINLSAGTTSNLNSAFTFSNGNGVSFGLNAGTITASVAAAGGAQTAISGIIVSDATYTSGTVSFSNAGNITISSSTNGASQYIRLSVAAQSTQSAIKGFGVSNTGQTAGNTGISTGIDWVLAGSQSITLSQSTAGGGPNTVWFQHPAWLTTAMQSNAATISNINVSAGTTSNNLSAVVFSNSNGISFGLSGSTVTGSANTVGTATTVAAVASANSVGTVSRWAAEDHAHAGVAAIGISSATNANTAGTSGSEVGTYWLQGTAGITLSQITSNNGSHTLVISGPTPLSYWRNYAAEVLNQTQTMSVQGSTSYIQPLVLDADVSASYIRFLHSFAVTNTTSIATTANATGSGKLFSTIWAMLYTNNTGASSLSLKSIMSASAGMTQVWSLSANANGSQWTLSQSVTHPITGGSSNFTTGVTTSLTNYSLGSLSLTNFTGLQQFDIPFATLIPGGNYWLMYGASSSTATAGSGANFTNLQISNSIIVASQINSPVGLMGQATNASIQLDLGVGSFSTNAIGTTASLGFSNISSSASYPLMPVQLMRLT